MFDRYYTAYCIYTSLSFIAGKLGLSKLSDRLFEIALDRYETGWERHIGI